MTLRPVTKEPGTLSGPHPRVFLSSVFLGVDDVRKRMHQFGEDHQPGFVWVDEISNNRLPDASLMECIDDVLGALTFSELCIVLVGAEWPGSDIAIADERSQTTYFEIELLYAALLGKPIVLVVRDDIQVPPRTQRLLTMLRRLLPKANWLLVPSLHAAETQIKRLITHVAEGHAERLIGRSAAIGPFLLQEFWQEREPKGTQARLKWLADDFPAVSKMPNAQVVEQCLSEGANTFVNHRRLSLFWIAARELMGVPFWEPRNAEWLPQWNAVLTAWQQAAAWYGLHGHLYLGYLPALHSLTAIRAAGRQVEMARNDDPAWTAPSSSLGSAYYSVARPVPSWQLRREGLRRANGYLDQTRATDPLQRSSVLSIKGSVLRALGEFTAAVDAYDEVLRLRQHHGGSQAAIGEAMSELGYGLLFQLRWRRGHELLREGVRMMEDANGDPGFLIRGKRKLAIALRLHLRFREAAAVDREANILERTFTVARAGIA